ncbi:uncharacterized protein H6S33_003043 [Morchella sextelata]|uniref:uncharacterized protein n=1 Tax=Morchella sextelata TaxID=1174677 RepID=UPI001D057136|nr:uncharacterized protein H6S33_003043 [Morchella sextelata]KAH0607055.1 hypothetical protein H6S33_003043 [Morchella sextelata]
MFPILRAAIRTRPVMAEPQDFKRASYLRGMLLRHTEDVSEEFIGVALGGRAIATLTNVGFFSIGILPVLVGGGLKGYSMQRIGLKKSQSLRRVEINKLTCKMSHLRPLYCGFSIAEFNILSLLSPYLGHLDPLDHLLTSLQLTLQPNSPPKPLHDLLPQLLVGLGLTSTLLLLLIMRRFFARVAGGGATPIISGDASPDPNRTSDTITIKHGKDEFTLTYAATAITGGTLTVGDLRTDCSNHITADPTRISLLCAGKNLKDDAATLASLGISTAAKILCMGSSAPIPAAAATEADSGTAEKSKKKKKKSGAKARGGSGAVTPEVQKVVVLTPMQKIDAVWDGIVANLLPLTEDFVNSPPADAAKRADMHRRLSETMMGELLKLDSVESSEPEVRARRKGVVKDIQRVLDGLDRVPKAQGEVGDFDLD